MGAKVMGQDVAAKAVPTLGGLQMQYDISVSNCRPGQTLHLLFRASCNRTTYAMLS
jgi:hypothetical protein